jgi:hypothetical protein
MYTNAVGNVRRQGILQQCESRATGGAYPQHGLPPQSRPMDNILLSQS